MFDAGFPFTLIQHTVFQEKDTLGGYIFQFKTLKNKRYLVTVEEYKFKVFVPKFYPSQSRNNPKRFSLLTNGYEGSRIIRTIIDIMLFIYQRNLEASFAWIGVSISTKQKKESKSFTQRYRIYKNVMLNFSVLTTGIITMIMSPAPIFLLTKGKTT